MQKDLNVLLLNDLCSYGKALRTESLRIRAVYRPADGGLIEGDYYTP